MEHLNLTHKLRDGPELRSVGGYADLYSGCLEDGTLVAIKRTRFAQNDALTRDRISLVSPSSAFVIAMPSHKRDSD